MKRIIVTLLLASSLLAFISRALADLDDTMEESAIKYGPPTATGSPQILAYTHPPFRIWQSYDKTGHCVIAEFRPLDHAVLFTAHSLAELDCNNLPDAMIPGIGPGWEKVQWSGNSRGRNTFSFQYTGPEDTRYQVIIGQSRDDENGDWYEDRMYLNNAGIEVLKGFGLNAVETTASDAPRATRVYKTYTLRDGREARMSASQAQIANKLWKAVAPETIAEIAAEITVTIAVEKNDGTHILGTGFFINPSEVVTDWHVVRDADNITVVDQDGARCNAQLSVSKPSVDLAKIVVPSVYSKMWAHFDTDSDWERIGVKVYVYGNPQGMTGTFSDGMLSAIRKNGAVFQISAPTDDGSSGSPVFNQYGLVIGIVREKIVSSAELNFAVSSNAIYEALELKTDDHPDGFNLGLTQDLELRDSGEIDADIALENAARIEAENKESASHVDPDALARAAHDAEIRASNERALRTPQLPAVPTP
jgi:Trypsin-like peptidase domain